MQSEAQRVSELLKQCDKALARLRSGDEPASLELARQVRDARDVTIRGLAEVEHRIPVHRPRTN
jgi:hypothetical protein